eukprot:4455713-Amphidinium_carterae.2
MTGRYVLEWDQMRDEIVSSPTLGVRQGCKLSPILYRMVVEDALQQLSGCQLVPGPYSLEEGWSLLGRRVGSKRCLPWNLETLQSALFQRLALQSESFADFRRPRQEWFAH